MSQTRLGVLVAVVAVAFLVLCGAFLPGPFVRFLKQWLGFGG
jgi:hypothetical protein